MIVESFRKLRLLHEARIQPSLPTIPYVSETFNEVKSTYFPNVTIPVRFFFVRRGPLACIAIQSFNSTIYLHEVINHINTPLNVMGFIFKHEILHIEITPRIIDGKEKQHPPEFWEQEKVIAPERRNAWEWIWLNLGDCLMVRPKLEGIDVRTNWKELWRNREVTADELRRWWEKEKAKEKMYVL